MYNTEPPLYIYPCGQKVVGAFNGGNLRTHWWMPAVKEAVHLKKEDIQAWLAQWFPEAADLNQEVRKATASVVSEAKTWVWEEFGEAMRRTFSGLQDDNQIFNLFWLCTVYEKA